MVHGSRNHDGQCKGKTKRSRASDITSARTAYNKDRYTEQKRTASSRHTHRRTSKEEIPIHLFDWVPRFSFWFVRLVGEPRSLGRHLSLTLYKYPLLVSCAFS